LVGALLALLVHAVVIAGVLWRAELAPVRERLIRVVYLARESEPVDPAAAVPPVAAASAPPPAPAPDRHARRPPREHIRAPAPASPPEPAPARAGTAADARAVEPSGLEVASAPVPAEKPISARPRYKHSPHPSYPALARRRRQEGDVLLAVRVDAAGRPESVEVQESSGFASLDRAAVEAVAHWEFEPGRQDGAPVPSRVVVPIQFRLERAGPP
jgi:protein TonB